MYNIFRYDNGFYIERFGLLQANIEIDKDCCSSIRVYIYGSSYITNSFNILEFRKLKDFLTEKMKEAWKKNKHESLVAENAGKKVPLHKLFPHKNVSNWVRNKFSISLSSLLYAEYKNLLTKVDPMVLAICKKNFSVVGPKNISTLHGCIFKKEALNNQENQYVYKDMLKYNAIHYLLNKAYLKEGVIYFEYKADTWANDDEETNYRYAGKSWRDYFSNSSKNKSIQKTIDNFPRNIPLVMIENFRKIDNLREPIYDRLKILITLLCLRQRKYKIHYSCILRSSSKQIRKAFSLYKKHTRNNSLSLRKTLDIIDFCNFIFDYDHNHNGEIVGLLNKSIEWHKENNATRFLENNKLSFETKTQEPCINLPQDKCITFLDTVKAVFDEGQKMSHCISSYAKNAVNGEYFLFHVEYEKEMASVSVNYMGQISQSYGPYNKKNKASAYGEKILSKWGKNLYKKITENTNGQTIIDTKRTVNNALLDYNQDDYEVEMAF